MVIEMIFKSHLFCQLVLLKKIFNPVHSHLCMLRKRISGLDNLKQQTILKALVFGPGIL